MDARGGSRGLDDDGSEGENRKHDEGADADGPSEADVAPVEQLREDDGEDDGAERRAGDGEAHGGAPARVEVLRYRRHGWEHDHARRQAGQES